MATRREVEPTPAPAPVASIPTRGVDPLTEQSVPPEEDDEDAPAPSVPAPQPAPEEPVAPTSGAAGP
jgi:hypothetical protein